MTGNDPGSERSAPPPPPLGYASPPVATETNPEARTWGMLCHLSALAGYIIPLGNVIGPLVVWLIKKDQLAFVDDQGKESLNFQITMLIATVIAFVLVFVFVGIILLPIIMVLDLVFVIIASIRANAGEPYRYPFAIRLIK